VRDTGTYFIYILYMPVLLKTANCVIDVTIIDTPMKIKDYQCLVCNPKLCSNKFTSLARASSSIYPINTFATTHRNGHPPNVSFYVGSALIVVFIEHLTHVLISRRSAARKRPVTSVIISRTCIQLNV
jgi:hypothetical protein